MTVIAALAAQQPEIRLAEVARIDTRAPLPPRADRMRERPDRLPKPLPGCTSRLAFSADAKFVAAVGDSHGVLARVDGEIIGRFPETVGVATGEAGSEFWIFGSGSVRRWNAAHSERLEIHELPDGWRAPLLRQACPPSLVEHTTAVDDVCVVGGRTFILRRVEGPEHSGAGLFDPQTQTVRSLVSEQSTTSRALATVQMARSEIVDQIAFARGTLRLGRSRRSLREGTIGALSVYSAAGVLIHEEITERSTIAVAYSPGGSHLALAEIPGVIRALDTTEFDVVGEVKLKNTHWLAFLDERTLLGHDGRNVVACALPALDPIPVDYNAPRNATIHGAALSPDRTRLALSDGEDVTVFDIRR